MFALAIRYLNGWSMAATADRERPEWPPHPDRVFMALTAAHFDTEGGPEQYAALLWLERLEPPDIAASPAEQREFVPTFAPVNDTSQGLELLPEYRSRQSIGTPVAIPHDPDVYLVWSEIDCPPEHRAGIQSLCERVTSVGEPSSLVQMWIEPTPPAPTLVPAEPGLPASLSLRIFGRGDQTGRLARLEAHHQMEFNRGRRFRIPSDSIRYRELGYDPTPAGGIPHTVFDSELLILRRTDGPRLGLENTLALAEALRGAVMSLGIAQPPPVWVSGHEPDGKPSQSPHMSILPLADVAHEHALGHLLGIALAVPRKLDAVQLRRFGAIFFQAETGRSLPLELRTRCATWQVELVDDDPRVALRAATWTAADVQRRGALAWATVTPVVFDRHPKQKWTKSDSPRVRAQQQAAYWGEVETMIADACRNIGLPRPIEVVAGNTSALRGAPTAGRMPRLLRKDGSERRQAHAVIRFESPVIGPLLLGAGRYFGYGLCRPMPAGGSQ